MHSLPDVLVPNNGPQFMANQFELFLAKQGLRHALVALFYLASNEQVERMVRSAKEALFRMGPGDWQARINKFLLVQHITPSATTNRSASELLMGRRIRSQLDRLHPNYIAETPPDSTEKIWSFNIGAKVYAHNYAEGVLWIPATLVEMSGPHLYKVELEDGILWRRYLDQLRGRLESSPLRQPEIAQTDKRLIPTDSSQQNKQISNSDSNPIIQREHPPEEPRLLCRLGEGLGLETPTTPRDEIQTIPIDKS